MKTQELSIPFYRELNLRAFFKIKYDRTIEDYILHLSPLLLIEPYEIPFDLVRTENYQGIRDFVSVKTGLRKRKLSSDEKTHIQLYFELIKDFPLAKEAVKFLFLRTFKEHTEKSSALDVINAFLFIFAIVLISFYPLISCVLAAAFFINVFIIKSASFPTKLQRDIETVESLQGQRTNLAKGALHLWKCEQSVSSSAEDRNSLSLRIAPMQAYFLKNRA